MPPSTLNPIPAHAVPDATLLVVTGAPGTGKTFWAKGLAQHWSRPLVVWDMALLTFSGRGGVQGPSPTLVDGWPTALPDGWDVLLVPSPVMDRRSVDLGPQALLAWCERFRRERALALISTGTQRLRQGPSSRAGTPDAAAPPSFALAWTERFGDLPSARSFELEPAEQYGPAPYASVMGWRLDLDAQTLRRAMGPDDSSAALAGRRPRL